jgi:hypothetical protein
MKIRTMMITAGVVALGLAAWNTPSKAQGPMYDRVNVNLPYTVTVGNRTLQPGDYVIQQLRDQGGGSRVLLIYSDNGMKFETSAMTIPALDQNTPESTKVVLHHFGNDYYFDKVWIQGKDYGYEFPVPDSVKSRERERMQPISVAATYSTVQQSDTTSAANTTTTTAATTRGTTTAANSAATTRQTTTPAATNQSTTTAANSAATTAATSTATTGRATTSAATNQSTTAQAYNSQSPATTSGTMTAQNQTTTHPSTTQGRSTVSAANNSATTARSTARDMNDTSSADRSMPNTSAGWLMMLLGGGALSGAGMSLRRKR